MEPKKITREQLAELLAKLRQGDWLTIGACCDLIDAAGVPGNTWLYQCLLYENEATVWAAWEDA